MVRFTHQTFAFMILDQDYNGLSAHLSSKEFDVRKYLLLVIAAFVMVFAAGCVDLFAVPGVAVSPDGGKIYFLGGDFSFGRGAGNQGARFVVRFP